MKLATEPGAALPVAFLAEKPGDHQTLAG